MGGEKLEKTRPDIYRQGSPPRGRGKVLLGFHQLLIVRITPAWAGKSSPSGTFGKVIEDHPRVGGEKTKKIP